MTDYNRFAQDLIWSSPLVGVGFKKNAHFATADIPVFGTEIIGEVYLQQLGFSGGDQAAKGCTAQITFPAPSAYRTVDRPIDTDNHLGTNLPRG
jgi:hypothetical protein